MTAYMYKATGYLGQVCHFYRGLETVNPFRSHTYIQQLSYEIQKFNQGCRRVLGTAVVTLIWFYGPTSYVVTQTSLPVEQYIWLQPISLK